MSEISIDDVLSRLRKGYKGVDFQVGQRSEGYWIRAVELDGHWSWERFRMASPAAVFYFAQVALSEFYGA